MILRQTSMVAILSSLGYDTRRSANGLYLSPFRPERVGSLHINDEKHIWCDHGGYDPTKKGGKPGGDTIRLVMDLKECSFVEALDFLATFNPNITPISDEEMERRRQDNRPSKIHIEKVDRHWRHDLLEYGTKIRKIPEPLLKRYCSQVTVTFGDSRTPFTYIGFPNIEGGWSLRNNMDKLSKISSKSGYTLLDSEGNYRNNDETPTSKTVVLFEGFFDFLSWLAWNRIETPGMDVVVLNSTTNLLAAMPSLTQHGVIASFLDNDDTGRKYFDEVLMKRCAKLNSTEGRGIRVLNSSEVITPGKDFADMYVQAVRKEELRAFARQREEELAALDQARQSMHW